MKLNGGWLQTTSLEGRSDQERFDLIANFMLCHIMVCTAREREREAALGAARPRLCGGARVLIKCQLPRGSPQALTAM